MRNTEENRWDRLLRIRTTGRDDSRADQYRYPYEPTPYSVLERLAGAGYIRKGNTLLDYGCGKGRVDFFLAGQTRCRAIGVEYDARIYEKASENQKTAVSAGRTVFMRMAAEDYPVPGEVDRIYFFNPFSLEILRKVMGRILESYYETQREILLFFYYPSDEYLSLLMTEPMLQFQDEIDCQDLFDGGDPRERILIFELVHYGPDGGVTG
ncbi:MAG TPA: class I SAM-dependent methyltransferase [Candidatus Ruminococcus avistercoris]|nr:class I SAM-dependent methyltransferase [Candidatus Ruminococcus avistercoris]